MKRSFYILLIAVAVALSSLSIISCRRIEQVADAPTEPVDLDGAINVQGEYDIITDTNGVKYIVPPSKIVGGGPPRDGIPSIDNPNYESVSLADEWIRDDELVLGITYKGVKRAYPLQIMVWHEIVNDTIAGDPLLITY